MKKYLVIVLFVMLTLTVMSANASVKRDIGCIVDRALGAEIAEERQDTIHQISVYEAYQKEYYNSNDNKVTVEKYGDFGMGLLKKQEGAIIFLDGNHYKVKDFNLMPLQSKEYVPIAFGMFKFFDVDDKITVKHTKNINDLNNFLDKKLETLNYFAAIKAKGKFNSLQLQMPDGATKEVTAIKGTLVGFRMPDYYNSVVPKGYVYYFVSDDLSISAKVVDVDIDLLSCAIDYTNRLEIILPKQRSFKLRDFAQYEPKVKDTSDKKLTTPTFQRDREKMMSTPKGEPTPEEMMQMFAPKATW